MLKLKIIAEEYDMIYFFRMVEKGGAILSLSTLLFKNKYYFIDVFFTMYLWIFCMVLFFSFLGSKVNKWVLIEQINRNKAKLMYYVPCSLIAADHG